MSTPSDSVRSQWRTALTACLLLATLAGCGRSRSRSSSGRAADKALFNRGRDLVVRGAYDQAVPVLREYQERFPTGRYASRAGLHLGKAHLGLRDFGAAADAFTEVIAKHPKSLEAHKCRFKLALLAMLRGNEADAAERFGALADPPSGPLAPEAAALRDYLRKRSQ